MGMDEYQIPRERMIQRLREHYKIVTKSFGYMSRVRRDLFVPKP